MKRTLMGLAAAALLALAVPAQGQLPVVGLLDRGLAARFLTQTTFGPTLDEINTVSLIGRDAWLAQQLLMPPTLHQPRFESLLPMFEREQQARLAAWWQISLTAPDQLRQRVAFALSEIFVVSDQDAQLANRQVQLVAFYDILVRGAFGNFRDLIEDVTLSPAMGLFLSHLGNDKANPDTGRRPDENYAREAMQLFSIGLWQLDASGRPLLDVDGERIPSYDQETVEQYARVYTGWTWAYRQTFGRGNAVADETTEPMKVFAEHHDSDAKTLLSELRLPAGQSPEADLEAALDSLFRHPNVPAFIARQLIIKLVTSNPSPAFVGRIAAVFRNNGFGARGDLGAMVTAIFLDPEARRRELSDPDVYGKLKEPLLRLGQLFRAFEATSVSGLYGIGRTDGSYGQSPLSAPSVFNFFSPSYALPGPIEDAGLVSPEFQLQTETQSMLIVDDLARRIAADGSGGDDVLLDLGTAESLADAPEALADHLQILMLGGEMSGTLRRLLLELVSAVPEDESTDYRRRRAQYAVTLVAVSPEYAVQR